MNANDSKLLLKLKIFQGIRADSPPRPWPGYTPALSISERILLTSSPIDFAAKIKR